MDEIVFYRRATADDVEALTSLRLEFLAEVSGADLGDGELRAAIAGYFAGAIGTDRFTAFVGVVDSKIIASSGLTYHFHPPSNKNPTGREGYIMNMYTVPEWRRRGIASRLLEMLVEEAKGNECGKVSLHVMPKGRSIYERTGFVRIETEMRLDFLGRKS